MHRHPQHPPPGDDGRVYDTDPDRVEREALPPPGLIFRRTAIMAAVVLALIALVALWRGHTSGFSFAAAVAIGGVATTLVGMILGIGATQDVATRSHRQLLIQATWNLATETRRSNRRNRFIYGTTVPLLLAGLLLFAAGFAGMRLA